MSAIPSAEEAFERGSNSANHDERGRFVIGHKRSRGRPKGSRVKLAEDVVADVLESWRRDGPVALARTAFSDPGKYLDFIAKVLPKEVKLEISTPTDGMSDDELAEVLEHYRAIAALKAGAIEGEMRDVTPALAAPSFETPPVPEAEQRAEAERQDLLDQSDAINAATPYPVFRKPPAWSTRDDERNIVMKLVDINTEDLF